MKQNEISGECYWGLYSCFYNRETPLSEKCCLWNFWMLKDWVDMKSSFFNVMWMILNVVLPYPHSHLSDLTSPWNERIRIKSVWTWHPWRGQAGNETEEVELKQSTLCSSKSSQRAEKDTRKQAKRVFQRLRTNSNKVLWRYCINKNQVIEHRHSKDLMFWGKAPSPIITFRRGTEGRFLQEAYQTAGNNPVCVVQHRLHTEERRKERILSGWKIVLKKGKKRELCFWEHY